MPGIVKSEACRGGYTTGGYGRVRLTVETNGVSMELTRE